MGLRIRELEISVITAVGKYGARLSFANGLNVLSAPNSSGKSTCVMAILYGLGLEGMLGPSHNPPFPDAMLSKIMVSNDTEVAVVESFVRLEIENDKGERVTAKRLVAASNLKRQLVRCELGPSLSQPHTSFPCRDFYVRIRDAAQEESGFHRFLAEFLGYTLPEVPASDNHSITLYLECLFPFFFVDQLSGWRDIKARMPTYLRVPEMAKRSTEYILNMDVLHRAIERQRYELRKGELQSTWQRLVDEAKRDIGKSQIVIRGLPQEPSATWPLVPPPQLLLTDGENWIALADAIKNLLDRQKELVEEAIPHAEEVSQQVLAELGQKEESLESQLRRLEAATRDSMAEKANVDALTLRLQALLDDYRQYQDAKKVEAREGDPPLKTATGICPTCNQEIKDSLLRQELAAVPMSIDDNMVFIRDQIDTFRRMLTDAKEVSDAKQKQVDALRRRIGEINDRVRALKRTLHSDGNAPSIAAVQEQVQIEHRAQGLSELEAQFAEYSDRFAELSKEWTEVLSKLKSLVNVGLSENDEVKLQVWQSSFVTQLRDYGFGSMPIDQLSLSRDSYKPSRLGYEVGLTSASDAIRMIWAYLIGMMATSRRFPTNHLGLLVFDEPRQQGTKLLSFDALLKSAAAISGKTQQIVFVTSEEKEKLETSLAGIECNLIRSEGRILRSVTS